ncbi:MAG: NAD(P)/FAD-dependent oxidoreductase [Candidatus Melainabacteria bacterium]|nr:NAD(P)/FAD-dependent oxidoreductase [Candidatus Melainabacteria bacterium]
MSNNHHRIVIVGGGTAGISCAARLMRVLGDIDIAIVEPATKHYYQPLWTLVGAGVMPRQESERDESLLIPSGVKWIKESVVKIDPDRNSLRLSSGTDLGYDYLIMAAGLQIDWHKVKGLQETIGRNGVCSNYAYDQVDYTWQQLSTLQKGKAIFTQPNTPVKCGGAPQKIAYLADDQFRLRGVRDQIDMIFASANPGIFSVKKYADSLNKVVARKGIQTWFRTDLIELDGDKKTATFQNLDTQDITTTDFDMIHVTPPMSAPDFIKQSALADTAGWVDVDKHTLRHNRYANVFALGDCSNLPTSKTGAAIRKQSPVVVANLAAQIKGAALEASYDGYTSCPLVTGYGRLILAEFDYDLNPAESFPLDQSEERYSMYVLKKDLLPQIYWRGMMKGLV